MNKKTRTGPRIRLTRAANRDIKIEEPADERNYIYTCQYCRVKFTQNSQFFRHMISNHQSLRRKATFECNDCQVVFNKKSNLDQHCQTNHQAKSKSKCDSCSITFKSRYCLRRHLELKKLLAENSCRQCQKKFALKYQLEKHVLNKHTSKAMTHECDHCSLKFRAKRSLLTHLKRIHNRL
ncbi:PR domain zinc finger protein 5-like [Aricia agestis]|uniref:PR domain zinc finger protein 5-like n=1 Tax=Aricia agestis TaxID=91739 RepID=UPI001C204317|nr:PR domain zinc finger protein 5-like [Aricia agestis]